MNPLIVLMLISGGAAVIAGVWLAGNSNSDESNSNHIADLKSTIEDLKKRLEDVEIIIHYETASSERKLETEKAVAPLIEPAK